MPISVYHFGSRYQHVCGVGEALHAPTTEDGVNRLLGETHLLSAIPNWSDVAKKLEIATDGIVKDGRGRSAATIFDYTICCYL